MEIGRCCREQGTAALSLVAWLVAIVGIFLAASVWLPSRAGPKEAPHPQSPDELATLRLALSTMNAQNAALRKELDRLIASGAEAASGNVSRAAGSTASAPVDGQDVKETATRIVDAVSRAAAIGDDRSKREAAMTLMASFQGGAESLPALREAYLSTADPNARKMILPMLMFVGGEGARDLVTEQLRSETDPGLKKALTRLSVKYATPDHAPELKASYLAALHSDADLETRISALRGLRYAEGPDVQEALIGAATDASEAVRLAAIDSLSSRPAMREHLQEIVQAESSPQLREIGECQLRLSGDGS